MSALTYRRGTIVASFNASADLETTSEGLRDFRAYQSGIFDFEGANFLGTVESDSSEADGIAGRE